MDSQHCPLKGTADYSRCVIAPWYYHFLTTQFTVLLNLGNDVVFVINMGELY